ncbi:MAG: cupin domain-containing protein [Saprospiraceae bacterium]|nr:cupin domain-containing protein [Saprospiraceae bacterium]
MKYDLSRRPYTLLDCYDGLEEYFSPRVIGKLNDSYIKIAKIKGDDLPWHHHEKEDELFIVIKGKLKFESAEHGTFALSEGQAFIIKHGIEHRVSATEECYILLIEPVTTAHTGQVKSKMTKSISDQLGE